jgi:HEAT repeat protein
MKSAIPGLTEAVSSSDRNVRNTAIDAVSALSKQGAPEIFLLSVMCVGDVKYIIQ